MCINHYPYITLGGFAPLIQLWAGFCLLYFYTKLIEDSRFYQCHKDTANSFKRFLFQLQAFISTDELKNGYERVAKMEKSQEAYIDFFKHVNTLLFYFSSLLLIYVAVEKNRFVDAYFPYMLVVDFFVTLYVIFVFLWRKKFVFSLMASAVVAILCFIVIPLFLIFCFPDLPPKIYPDCYCPESYNFISIITVVACMQNIFYAVIWLIRSSITLWLHRRLLKSAQKTLSALEQLLSNPNAKSTLTLFEGMNEKEKKDIINLFGETLLKNMGDPNVDTAACVQEIMENKVKEFYNSFVTPINKINYFLLVVKEFILWKKERPWRKK
ncbi:hypothetical protein [Porphyromonas gulae]|uniref:Uncharacterized protein n=1 Tax=Porphyromonas gulae TaxID=111105 RepID=A0A0A2F3E2_9PORP|nr:hypothetical protein [Porphyromonas gulae]KGN84555.1 hypothetical protein HR15_10750 [Porphyromonas gulae]